MLTVEESEPGRVIVFKGPGPEMEIKMDISVRCLVSWRLEFYTGGLGFDLFTGIGLAEENVGFQRNTIGPLVPAKIYADILAIDEVGEDCWYPGDRIFIGG